MRSALLIVLGLGFAGFGAMEVAGVGGRAASAAEAVPSVAASDVAAAMGDNKTCLTPALAASFSPMRLALDEERSALDARAEELSSVEAALDMRLAELEQAHAELKAMSHTMDETAAGDISHLVAMYSTMKAKQAAEIFDRMDPGFAAGFLREMKSDRAGMIMAEMKADQSYKISLLIANRNAAWRSKSSAN